MADDGGYNQSIARDSKGYLVRAHHRYENCFILIKGLLFREHLLGDGRRQIVGLHVPGDVCNLAALSDGCADCDMVALSPVSYLPVGRHWLSRLALESSDVSLAVWRELSREASISAAWTVNVGQRRAYRRVAYFMCELEARLRAAGQDTSNGFEWPGTQADIGAVTGLSLVHLNRTLRALEDDALLSYGRHVTVPDIAKLRAVADFDPSYLALGQERLGDMLLSLMGEVDKEGSKKAFPAPPRDGHAL